MNSRSESTPKRFQGQRRPARSWLCAGAPSNGDRGKLSIESPQARERRWLVIFLRWSAFLLVLCCAGAALSLAWYIPYWSPGWYSAATRWLDAHMLFAVVLSIILVCLLFWLILWKLPQWQVVAVPEMKDRIDLESKSRQTLAQILGGAAFLVGLYFTSQTLRTTQEGQITDRFTKAIDQLGKDTIAVRLGGIYALERIARDSESDHWAVMEVLTAFVREQAPATTKPPDKTSRKGEKTKESLDEQKLPAADIQAILTVIGRRTRTFGNGENKRLDLHNVNLQGADLSGAELQGADLSEAQLQRARLTEAQLQGAITYKVQLQGAYLWEAQLQGAVLTRAQLQGAKLGGAQLQGAHLREAQLQGADLLWARLDKASLHGANLTTVVNLTQNQIDKTCPDENTQVPKDLKRPECLSKELKLIVDEINKAVLTRTPRSQKD